MGLLTPAYIDRGTSQLYYLAFDLQVARAPIRKGVAYAIDGCLARARCDSAEGAKLAAIRVALLGAWFADNPARQSTVDEAKREALEIAKAAGLDEPVSLEPRSVRLLNLAPITPLAADS